MRQQLPSLYDLLKKIVAMETSQTENQKRKISSQQRKSIKLLDTSEALFSNLNSLFNERKISSLAILFGNSSLSPKETYLLKLNYNPSSKELADAKTSGDYVRMMIRTLVMQDLEIFNSNLQPTKIFVLVYASRGYEIEGFLPKQNFQLKTNSKSLIVNINLGVSNELEMEDEDNIWYQSELSIQGLRTSPVDESLN